MRMVRSPLVWLALAALPLPVSAQLSACKPADVSIDKLARRVEGNVTHITGQVVNKCPQAVGAHIRIALNDNTNSPLMVQDFWPANTKNIPAMGTFPFDSQFRNAPAGVAKFEGRVLEVKFWPVR